MSLYFVFLSVLCESQVSYFRRMLTQFHVILPLFLLDNLQVIFRNEQSGEYLFYYVTFKAVPPGVMATIDLSTPIRKSTSHVVTLHNPLSTPVTFNSQCSVADIQLPPSFTVPPLSEVSSVTT